MEPESEYPPGIGRVATRSLAQHGYTSFEQLTVVSERELLAIHGVGPKAVQMLRAALAERGERFAP